MTPIPGNPADADAWILARRGPRNTVDARRPHAFFIEEERSDTGRVVPVLTVFLTNRECPWHCLMCDLWQNTTTRTVPEGAIPDQITVALRESGLGGGDAPGAGPAVSQIKLYNSGSFFDAGAIPPSDHPRIARQVARFDRVIVESHPALIGDRCFRFRDLLGGRTLEVAMGLETAEPRILARLNKRVTLDGFAAAAARLRREGVAVRAFVIVKAPFQDDAAGLEWAQRSIDFALGCGATVVTLIPTRAGNGAMEALAARGEFAPPRLDALEAASAYGVRLGRGRIFADLWDLERFSSCPACFPARRTRLWRMNLEQQVARLSACAVCGTEPGGG